MPETPENRENSNIWHMTILVHAPGAYHGGSRCSERESGTPHPLEIQIVKRAIKGFAPEGLCSVIHGGRSEGIPPQRMQAGLHKVSVVSVNYRIEFSEQDDDLRQPIRRRWKGIGKRLLCDFPKASYRK